MRAAAYTYYMYIYILCMYICIHGLCRIWTVLGVVGLMLHSRRGLKGSGTLSNGLIGGMLGPGNYGSPLPSAPEHGSDSNKLSRPPDSCGAVRVRSSP